MSDIALVMFLDLSIALADPVKPDVSWEELYSKKGIIVEKGLVDDMPYHAFRGTGIVDDRIGRVISVLFDHNRSDEWVHRLVASRELRRDGDKVVVWQRFNAPWPIRDRIFVYIAEPEADADKKFFQALFSDISDNNVQLTPQENALKPDQSCCIEGALIYTEWQFRATGPSSTCVRVEVMLNAKGKVPTSFVNRIQRKWPYATIRGLRQQVLTQDVTLHNVYGDWAPNNEGSIISREQCYTGKLSE